MAMYLCVPEQLLRFWGKVSVDNDYAMRFKALQIALFLCIASTDVNLGSSVEMIPFSWLNY